MYATCLFCAASLGRNETLEHFPVGRRLAYDASRGRLWVVCAACARWNLTPLDARWEAIESAERLYGETRQRVSTDNIGLARVGDGLELVRIGAPKRHEFAAWRYGDQFGRRRQRQFAQAGALGAAGVGLAAGTLALVWAGLPVIGGGTLASLLLGYGVTKGLGLVVGARHGNDDETVARTFRPLPDGGTAPLVVLRRHLRETSLVKAENEGFALGVHHTEGHAVLYGDHARRVAARLVPATNRLVGSRRQVTQAVARLDRAGDSERFLAEMARRGPRLTDPRPTPHEVFNGPTTGRMDPHAPRGLYALEESTRLAFEMALHEEQERRALEGELATLETAWREAEEIAAIADDLTLPASVSTRLGDLKRAHDGDGAG